MKSKFEKMYVKALKLHIKEATKFLLDCREGRHKKDYYQNNAGSLFLEASTFKGKLFNVVIYNFIREAYPDLYVEAESLWNHLHQFSLDMEKVIAETAVEKYKKSLEDCIGRD